MPMVDEILGVQLIPSRQWKDNRLVTGATLSLGGLTVLLQPACTPFPGQCLRAEPGHQMMKELSAVMLLLGAGPAREHETPKQHAWEKVWPVG